MSTSNPIKSHSGDPATYQQMQQALFKFTKNADHGSSPNETETVIAVEASVSTSNTSSEVPLKPNAKETDSAHETTRTTEAPLATASTAVATATSIPLVSSPNKQQSSRQISEKSGAIVSPKSGPSQGSSDRLPLALNLGDTKPIKPRPAVSGTHALSTVVAETKNSPITSGLVAAAAAASAPVPKTTTNSTTTKPKSTARRRGKWTVEEEEYVARVIQDFNSGFLNAPAGYTLRSYLSDKLQCDPMRITKKFTGESCIGKRVFHPAVRSAANAAAIDKAQAELDALERRWRRRLELQQRESAKKAAASAAAANAASRGTVTVQGVPVSMLGANSQSSTDSQLQQSAVTQAATWLDRANVILMGNSSSQYCQEKNTDETRSSNSSMEDSLEHQMKEVQRLIYEGPMIQQTTAGLPNLLLRTAVPTEKKHHVDNNTIIAPSSIPSHLSPTLEPADKRMRIVSAADSNPSGAEDAEALVGFLRSVRASAAAGQEL